MEWTESGDVGSTEGIVIYGGRLYSSSSFIEDLDYIDVPCMEGHFTWFNSAGTSMSRLDRLLVSDNLIEVWKTVGQYVGNRGISNHFPIWLKASNKDLGPKSFKFNNGYLKHLDFPLFIEK